MKIIIVAVLGLFNVTLQVSPSEIHTPSCSEFTLATKLHRGLFSDENKCLGETYRFGHQIEKFWNECSVEPENEFLSYVNSVWIFYKCIVQKSLGTRPLDLTNFATMMSANLSETTRSSILSILIKKMQIPQSNKTSSKLKFNDGETGDVFLNATELSELQDLKKYWKEYFYAEFKVCTNSPNNTCDQARTEKDMRLHWEPSQICQNGIVPDYSNLERNYRSLPKEKIKACLESFNTTHYIPNWTSDINFSLTIWCWKISVGTLNQTDMNNIRPFNFESLYNRIIAPKFYSQSLKQSAFNQFRNHFSDKYATYAEMIKKSESVRDILSCAVKYWEKKLDEEKFTNSDDRRVLTNAHIVKDLFRQEYTIGTNLCDPDSIEDFS